MDDDEAQKRNTDCVYFLASPLTCKKGSECEYRHSEIARLNPRDCWFWLGGSCLNPSCAFRHPPLDGMLEMLSDTVPSQPPPSLSMNKINVACHFYFNGFCIKGSNCPFLHGSSEFLPTQNPKIASTSVEANPAVNKASTGSEMVAGSVETAPYPTGGAAKTLCPQIQPPVVQPDVPLTKILCHQIQPTVGHPDAPLTKTLCHRIPPTVVQPDAPLIDSTGRSSSPEASMIDEGVSTKLSESPPDFVNGRSLLCPDESSEDQGSDGVEHEEWWESSPGFDVLVDDGSEQLGPEEDAKYLENHLIQYEFEDPIGFDHMDYIDAGILYKHGIYDSYDRFEGLLSDHARKVPDDFRERFPESRLFESRRVYGWESESEQRRSVDLRNRLRKQRMMNGDQLLHSSRKRRRLYDNNRDRSRRHEMGGTIRGGLASEVGKNMIGSHSEAEHRLKENGRGWSRRSQLRLSSVRQQEKERRRRRRNAKPGKLCSEISKGLPAKEAKPRELSQTFMGPKTLAQIKEEKRRSTGDGSRDMGHRTSQNLARLEVPNRSRVVSKDFQGPKPLHELLKHKNKPRIVSDEAGQQTNPLSKEDSMPRLSKHFQGPLERRLENGLSDEDGQMVKSGTSNQFLESDNDFLDGDDDDDDDELAKKIAIVFA